MDDADYVTILKRVWEMDGIFESYESRVMSTCEWLHNNTDRWIKWIPNMNEYMFEFDILFSKM